MKKIISSLLLCLVATTSVAEEEYIPDGYTLPIMTCDVKGKEYRFLPDSVDWYLQGMNGNPDGIILKDVNGNRHVIYFTKDSPYKCKIVEETGL